MAKCKIFRDFQAFGEAIALPGFLTTPLKARACAGEQGSRGAGEQGSRGAGEQGSRGAGEQGSRGAGEQGRVQIPSSFPSAPLLRGNA
ncbi:hypothetical protein [Nostoc sp.]|uniref:hypothetical protein n=1 Tax=Nostoc sp. TaxID=1180 RepID=UPI002FF85E64